MSSCATYYAIHGRFNRSFQEGDYRRAASELNKGKRRERGRARFVFFLDKGVTHHLLGEWSLSNEYLEKAYLFGEDYARGFLRGAVSAVTSTLSPRLSLYKGEDFEHIIPLYYKVLNYLLLADPESALVECRRIDLRAELLSQKYKSGKKFRRDAFAHLVMGIIYEANGAVDNAFVAYRNAYEVYNDDYQTLFGISSPRQLLRDMARTAYLSGFTDEYAQISREYEDTWGNEGAAYNPDDYGETGDVVLLWNNGMGPYKSEANFMFVKVPGLGGAVSFTNEEHNIIIPFLYDDGDFGKFNTIRVTFPQYVERPLYYSGATLRAGGRSYPLELAEDVNAIAFKSLRQRMVHEVSKAIVRMSVKGVVKRGVRSVDSSLGLLTDIAFLFTEHSDTRGWQTSPHSIYYARVSLPEGEHKVVIDLFGSNDTASERSDTLLVNAVPGRVQIYAHHTMKAQFADTW